MQSLQKGHILEFVALGKTFNPNVGIRTNPRQTYGVSEQSPEQFHQGYSLIGENGYIYKHENKPEFSYPSQRHFFNVSRVEQLGDPRDVAEQAKINVVSFHRKKGRLTEFMDKNGWMSNVVPLMGVQRTPQARALSNNIRKNRINSLKSRPQYQNPVARKPSVSPEYRKTISVMMGEKLRIKKLRQELASRQGPATARSVPQQHTDPLQVENVTIKMAKTNMDFYSTCSTFYPRNGTAQPLKASQNRHHPTRLTHRLPHKNAKQESFSSQNYRTLSPVKPSRLEARAKAIEEDPLESKEMNLQQWHTSTCHDKWVYNPKKLDTEDMQEMKQLQMSTNL